MKKLLTVLCLLGLILSVVGPVMAASSIGGTIHLDKPKPKPQPKPQPPDNPPAQPEAPAIFINGVQLYSENSPTIDNGRTLVPLAVIFRALNQDVAWHPNDSSITSGNIWLQVNNTQALVGDMTINLDVPAKIINSRTYVPLAFISLALGKDIAWDGVNRRIDINDKRNSDLEMVINTMDYGNGEIVATCTFTNVGTVEINKVNYLDLIVYLIRDDDSYETVETRFTDLALGIKPGQSKNYTLTITSVPSYTGVTSYSHEFGGEFEYK